MKTPVEKVLQNIVDDFESEMRIFEGIPKEHKDAMFYEDYTNISYITMLNVNARIKEVLFRLSINKPTNLK
tara:strand:+ start:276 stop:488 length:213 start_codon:yes stop_codon:yes gene_type:complete